MSHPAAGERVLKVSLSTKKMAKQYTGSLENFVRDPHPPIHPVFGLLSLSILLPFIHTHPLTKDTQGRRVTVFCRSHESHSSLSNRWHINWHHTHQRRPCPGTQCGLLGGYRESFPKNTSYRERRRSGQYVEGRERDQVIGSDSMWKTPQSED